MSFQLEQPDSQPVLSQDQPLHARPLPQELEGFRNYHAGETILVCGCGSSLSEIVAPERFVAIGVNDVGRLFQPDYLVVINPKQQFRGDRFRYVEESRARAIFTQLHLGITHPHIVRFKLGKRGGVDFTNPHVLHYTRNSPYLALCLAVHMGAKRVGMIGVDFTDNHFFASTGRHPLAGEFPQIDREYNQLNESCLRLGVEVVNLSQESRLTAFPKMSPELFARLALLSPSEQSVAEGRKVFFVNHRFIACGEVFQDGLSHAADDLNVQHEMAYWDDPELPDKVDRFSPDLLFVVNGRKFARRWGSRFKSVPSAVWLLDEPYEVDDTSRFSNLFDTVFVNDPGIVHRHRNAHYLPVCYDPHEHSYRPGDHRTREVGFVGVHNALREQLLDSLCQRKLLSYVVGGPWRKPCVNAVCLSDKIPAHQTASLYKETRIVINIFRIAHQFNREHIPGASLNPRVYEAMQCGALVVSQNRSEFAQVCPDAPVFESAEDLISIVEQLLEDPMRFEMVRRSCIRQLAAHSYAHRLSKVLSVTMDVKEILPSRPLISFVTNTLTPARGATAQILPEPLSNDWESDANVMTLETDGTILMHKPMDTGPGTEQGLVGKALYKNLTLSFEVFLERNSSLVAKIHQVQAHNQLSNSYHLFSNGPRAYFARHNHSFHSVGLPEMDWVSVSIIYHDGIIIVKINGEEACYVRDQEIPEGFCFIGIKGGAARLRNIKIAETSATDILNHGIPAHSILYEGAARTAPVVSIITTVYDRVECLKRCLRSVGSLSFQDYEQIVVADCPPDETLEQLRLLTEQHDHTAGKRLMATLNERSNDWGISPASAGLFLSRGKYVCFLSDDNGYTPDHIDPLVEALENDKSIGFAYSSCLYAGRMTLHFATPRFGRIDLGQPMFRRELFDRYLDGRLPFREAAWDWRMIERFMRGGVRWRHINKPTFIFRLDKYPHLVPELQ